MHAVQRSEQTKNNPAFSSQGIAHVHPIDAKTLSHASSGHSCHRLEVRHWPPGSTARDYLGICWAARHNSARCAVASVGKAVIHESANRRCNQDFTLLQVSQPNSCSWCPMGLERQFLLTQPCHVQYLRLVLGFVMVKVLVRTSRKRAHECNRLLSVSPTWSIKTHVRWSKGCVTCCKRLQAFANR